MEIFIIIIDFILNIDVHLGGIIAYWGALSYAILAVIIFAETGLVFTPFLPGDSLLFAAGAFSALGSFNIFALLFSLWAAAFLGDAMNYWLGRYFGQKIIKNKRIPINQKHIDKTQKFYDKYGGKTIFLSPASAKWNTKNSPVITPPAAWFGSSASRFWDIFSAICQASKKIFPLLL